MVGNTDGDGPGPYKITADQLSYRVDALACSIHIGLMARSKLK